MIWRNSHQLHRISIFCAFNNPVISHKECGNVSRDICTGYLIMPKHIADNMFKAKKKSGMHSVDND